MTTPPRFSEVVDGFEELAEWWVAAVSDHAHEVADKIDNGTFDANASAAAGAKYAALTALGGVALANEMLDAAAILSMSAGDARSIDSDPFTDPDPRGERHLALEGPMRSGFRDELPVRCVAILPAVLKPNEAQFRLRATFGLQHGGAYRGKVVVAAAGGGPARGINVWLTIA